MDVTIECLRPSAATLRVEDEHGNLVGQFNIADNTTVYELPLRVVYVLRGLPMNPKDPIGATPPRPLYARPGRQAQLQRDFERLNIITYLNTQSLNQALITCVLHAPPPVSTPQPLAPAYQLLIDEDQWKADGYLRGGVLQQPNELPAYCEKLVAADPAMARLTVLPSSFTNWTEHLPQPVLLPRLGRSCRWEPRPPRSTRKA